MQIVRDWVLKLNAPGTDGLRDCKPPGQPSRLTDAHRAAVKQYAPEAMTVVGLALREDKRVVDKITKGARMHA